MVQYNPGVCVKLIVVRWLSTICREKKKLKTKNSNES